MTKLEELINELCPDGVEYKRIDELCIITRGRVMSKDYIRDNVGQYPVYSSQTENNGELGKISTYDFEGEYLTWTTDGANAGSVFYRNGKFSVTNVCGLLKVKVDEITTKYLYHILSITAPKYVNKGMGNPKLMSNVMARIKVPLPPLSIQSEIVHILDSFTLLTAELTAELTARQKQYAFYRDYLLDFSNEDVTKKIPDIDCSQVKTLRLDEVAQIYDGTHQTPNYKDSGIPFISVENIKDIYGSKKYISEEDFNKYKIKPQINDVFMTRIGSIGDCAILDKQADLAYYVSLALIRPNTDIVISKYLKYVIESRFGRKELRKRTLVNAVPIKINKNDIGKIELPIPPLSVQENIVKILDRFDKLNNDMSEGLPAEIEARKKQYEYYRDALLSFDDKACSHIVKVERERELTRIKAIKWLKLSDIVTIERGKRVVRNDLSQEIGYPVYQNALKPLGYYTDKNRNANSVFVIGAGAAGEIGYSYVDYWAADDCFTFVCDDKLNQRYLYFLLMSKQAYLKNNVRKSSIPRLPRIALENMKIPVPPLEEQERIVSILDRFDKLCNDISEGLPAEIEARQKQYEYYRDKLLMFKRVEANEKRL